MRFPGENLAAIFIYSMGGLQNPRSQEECATTDIVFDLILTVYFINNSIKN
jgi:hypothetical protein